MHKFSFTKCLCFYIYIETRTKFFTYVKNMIDNLLNPC